MKAEDKPKDQLTSELILFNEQISGLKTSESPHKLVESLLRREREKFKKYLDIAGVVLVVIDSDQTVNLINKTGAQVLGYEESEILGKNWFDNFVPERFREEVKSAFSKLISGEMELVEYFENSVLTKAGQEKIIQWHNTVLRDEGNNIVATLSSGVDISERKRLEERLMYLSDCFIRFEPDPIKNINEMVACCGKLLGATCALYNRLDGEMLCSIGQWNTPADYNLKDSPQGHICYDVIQKTVDEIFIIRDLQNTSYAQTDSNVPKYNLQTYIGRAVKLGNTNIGSLCVVYQKDYEPTQEDKTIIEIIAASIGVEEKRRQAEEELKNYHDNLKELVKQRTLDLEKAKEETQTLSHRIEFILGATKTGLDIIDSEFNIIYIDPEWQKAYGDPTGKKCYEYFMDRDKVCPGCGIVKALQTKSTVVTEEVLAKENNRPIQVITVPFQDKDGKWLVAEANIDITERKKIGEQLDKYRKHLEGLVKERTSKLELEISQRKKIELEREKVTKELLKSNKKLKQLALKDIQTGLYNHHYLEEIIDLEFYRAKRSYHPLSVIMLDIDYFKSINNVYGHKFGDLVLKQFAIHLKKNVRKYDVIVRFGGEEFIILCPSTYRATALILAQRILDTVSLENFRDRKNSVKLKLTLGVVSYPEDKANKGIDLIEMLEKIINKAKEDGGNRIYSSMDARKKKGVIFEKTEETKDIKLLQEKLKKITKRANQGLVESIFAFAKTIKLKDHYTGEHVEKTVQYATQIAKALNLSKEEIEQIRQAAMVHDLGKIGISEKILLKKSKLTKKEFEVIKQHPQIGVDIIRPIQFLHDIIPLIFYHHERWDGRGYPSRLKREEIPIGARIIALADVYQALTSNRPYRKAYSENKATKIIKASSGTQFDPRIVSVFLKILQRKI